jgi:hypothetical protein
MCKYYVKDLKTGASTVVKNLKDAENILKILEKRAARIREDLRKTDEN